MAPLPVPEPAIVVVSGTQGAGKSTVSRALAERFERGAHIEADTLQHMIVAGGEWPTSREMEGEARRQLRLRLHNACLLARSFAAAGILAVVDDIIIGTRIADLREELAADRFVFVMLDPSPESVVERERGRGTALYETWGWMNGEIRERTERLGLWLDTTDLTVAETVDAIIAHGWTTGLIDPRDQP